MNEIRELRINLHVNKIFSYNEKDLVDTNILKMEKPVITKELTEEPSIQQQQQQQQKDESPLLNNNNNITLSVEDDNKINNQQQQQEEEEKDDTPKKAIQKNKGRCFSCRSKVKKN